NPIGFDLALILLRRDASWEVVARFVTEKARDLGFSQRLLKFVTTEQRTFFQNFESSSHTDSLGQVSAAVVSPIFGLRDEVVGALYGVRVLAGSLDHRVQPLEAQVVQLLAAAIGANLARVAATRTRVQFEQFFSAELVRELERESNLLEDREQEVTILVSDLRGFSGLVERLSPQTTGRLMRD